MTRPFVLFHLLALASSATAEPPSPHRPLKVVTSEWSGWTNKDGTGVYFEVLNAALGKGSYSFQMLPWKRAQTDFANGIADAIVGEDSTRKAAYPRWPLDRNRMSVVYRKNHISSFSMELLKRKKLVWVRGYDVDRFIPGLRNFVEASDSVMALRLLTSGRVDILIDFETDIAPALKSERLDPNDFVIVPEVVNSGFIYVCFQDDATGRAHARRFDEGMNRARKSGELERIYSSPEARKTLKAIYADIDGTR